MTDKCSSEKRIKQIGRIKALVATCRDEGPKEIAYIKRKRSGMTRIGTDCAVGFEPMPGDKVALVQDKDGSWSMEKIQ